MIEKKMLLELAAGEGAGMLVSAGSNIVEKLKSTQDWKKVFVDTGKFFIEHEKYAEQIFDDIAEVLSKENMLELAKALKNEDGYDIKVHLLDKLMKLMDKYEIPHSVAESYANGMLYTVLEQLREVAPEKYDHYFQQDWREEHSALLETISKKIDIVTSELAKYREQRIEIYSADEMDIRLKGMTINPKIGISFFCIDDDEFKSSFEVHKNDKCIYVKGKCQEEILYCILNELWVIKDNRAVFVVESYEDWERLRKISAVGHIYIPRFYKDEIVAIDGNTNIFIYSEDMPVFSHKALTLRPRTYATIVHALSSAGMDINEANKLVAETHGLYVPMKKKIFNGAYLKTPLWLTGIPEQVKKTCLLLGQWTEAEGDKAIIETLSGLKYEKFIEILLPFTVGEDPFIHKARKNRGVVYCLACVENTWDCMTISAEEPLWKRFTELLIEVLNESEALFTYSAQEKLLAEFKGETLFWSEVIRTGMIRTLIMKGFYRSDEECQRKLDSLVEKIFGYVQTVAQWKYISGFFVALCEVSPEAVLKRLDSELNKNTGLLDLFEDQSGDVLFERNEYINILWGIEQFLTQREYVSRALKWLLQLDDRSFEYKSNSPKDIFAKVYFPGYNFSALDSLKDKIQAAELALELDCNGWEHIYNALPGNTSSIIGHLEIPKYREHNDVKPVASKDVYTLLAAYLHILLKHMDFSVERWKKMLNFSSDVNQQLRAEIFDTLLYECTQMSDTEVIQIKNSIRGLIYRHRYFASAEWAMREDKIAFYEQLLSKIIITTPEYEYLYLFNPSRDLPLLNPVPYDKEGTRDINEKEAERIVQEKIKEFRENHYSLDILAKICAEYEGNSLGRALMRYWSEGIFDINIYELLIRNQISGEMALDYLWAAGDFNKDIFEKCFRLANFYQCKEDFIVQLYGIEAFRTSELPLISEAEESVKYRFWENSGRYSAHHEEWALSECRKYGTMQEYLKLLYMINRNKPFSAEQIHDYLNGIEKIRRSQDIQMADFYLENLLKPVQEAFIEDQEKCMAIAALEMIFMNILDWTRMRCFQREVKRTPEIFSQIVSIIFRHQGEERRNKSEKGESDISNAYELYYKAKFCPAEENDKVDIEKLQAWTDKFKILLAESRQSNLYGLLMGRLFAFSPKGKDGHEPCEAVRCMIERDADDSLMREYKVTVFNKRGGFTPNAGKSERRIAEKYRDNADFLSMKYPKTAEIYYSLAKEYEIYSKNERVEAENGY
ncbi:MAG: hypothetical protein HFG54_15630 [Lachnospiraceae bacterium]|nr:hypothetical protein [Lachnospiraceae bacterium]